MITASVLILLLVAAVIAHQVSKRLQDPINLRKLAARLLRRAMYLENLRAEETRLQGEAAAYEKRRLVEFGVLKPCQKCNGQAEDNDTNADCDCWKGEGVEEYA